MRRIHDHDRPIYGIARGLCIGACMWAPFIIGLGWAITFGSAASMSKHVANQETDLGSSYGTANGGIR